MALLFADFQGSAGFWVPRRYLEDAVYVVFLPLLRVASRYVLGDVLDYLQKRAA